MKNGDPIIAKLVDGSFAIGEYSSIIVEGALRESMNNANLVMLRQLPNGDVSAGIIDFMAPFIQDKQGMSLTQKDWIGEVRSMPESLVSEYTQRKTGIVLARVMPTSN